MALGSALAACGGGGGDGGGSASCSPAPRINSSPPAQVTVGQQYRYHVDFTMLCIPFVTRCGLELLQGPPGAGVDQIRDAVYWTPSAAEVGTSPQFVLATIPDACGGRATQAWRVTVFSPPVIQSFSSDRTVIAPGETVTLTAVFQGSGFVDGAGAVTSGVPITTRALTTDTSFLLRVSNDAGAELTRFLGIEVLTAPSITSFTASPATIGVGGSTTLQWSASGDIASVQLTPPGADVTNVSRYVVNPTGTITYTLSASNVFTSAAASVEVTVIPPANIRSFAATPPASVPLGAVSLSVDFDGTNGRIERELNGSYTPLASVNSGDVVASGTLYRSTRYRLSVENSLGQVVTRDLLVPLFGPGTFQPTIGQPLSPHRSYHTATRLLDGRVFIAGGLNAAPQTEIFNPATETFAAGPNFLLPRSRHGAALLQDGRVLVAGGCAHLAPCRTTEIFDVTAGTVAPGPLLANDAGAMVPLLDGRIVILTSVPGTPPARGVVLFNPLDGTLSPFISFAYPYLAPHFMGRLLDGRVLFVSTSPLISEIFTPGAASFSPAADAIAARTLGAAASTLLDGRVLVTGGLALPGTAAEAYDPASDVFLALGTQQIAEGFGAYPSQSSTLLQSGAVLVVGGNGSPLAQLFDPGTNAFSVTGGLRTGRSFNGPIVTTHTATLLNDGRVLVVGGCGGLPCEAETYTP